MNDEPKLFRVVRVLEYVGTEAWLDLTLSRNAVRPALPFPNGSVIRELTISRFIPVNK